MSTLLALVPIAIAALFWLVLYRVNRTRGWFRVGELIFWDAVILVLVYLAWLRWF